MHNNMNEKILVVFLKKKKRIIAINGKKNSNMEVVVIDNKFSICKKLFLLLHCDLNILLKLFF